MKKALYCLTLLGLALTGCNEGSEPMPPDSYKILNNSSSEITVETYLSERMSDKYTLSKLGVTPSDWLGSLFFTPANYFDGYCTISNGQKTVTHKCLDGDVLFKQESYILFDAGDRGEKTYLFVITDDFFKNGTPVEQKP